MAARLPKPEPQTLRIIMLHGYTQSGPIFHTKTRALEKLLTKLLAPSGISLSLIYPTAPMRLTTAQIPGHTPPSSPGGHSSHSRSSSFSGSVGSASSSEEDNNDNEDGDVVESFAWHRHQVGGGYYGLRHGMRAIATAIREAGGVDAVIGFSQGAAIGAIVTAALEQGRKLPAEDHHCAEWVQDLRDANDNKPLRFSVLYSGYRCRVPSLSWAYDAPIRTPVMFFLGMLDSVIDESKTVGLAERCEGAVVVRHPGGHHVPTARQWAMPVAAWIRDHAKSVV